MRLKINIDTMFVKQGLKDRSNYVWKCPTILRFIFIAVNVVKGAVDSMMAKCK